ncbi:phosphohistidine phosphatase SixA [Echinicola strongylocentroti]|uniref:Phosphohistidine phosphatase SixA n=1 Tax=Echinicola strongylocentroti TaxID=1795355 RepID=A0A2Z4IPZ6_9BACT|nr:histidine phosphatase family protein [Echinicola strongylocentroti]AWW32907.1 phosphohistidine phosphatase SixA [Echinicola strongylocentroti]
MTKTLTLLRHGEAEYGNGQLDDRGRKLTTSGKLKLERLTKVLAERKTVCDTVFYSPAVRTRETTEIILKGLKSNESSIYDALYLADSTTIIDLLGSTSPEKNSILVVGHNPGISALLSFLTSEYHVSLLPGMMAVLEFQVDAWEIALNRGMGSLVEILQ